MGERDRPREDACVVLAPVSAWAVVTVLGWVLALAMAVTMVLPASALDERVLMGITLGATVLASSPAWLPRVRVSLLGDEVVLENLGVGRQHVAYGAIAEVALEEPEERSGWLAWRGLWRVRFVMRGGDAWTVAMWSSWRRDVLDARVRGLVGELQERVAEASPIEDAGGALELAEPMGVPVGVSADAVSLYVVLAGVAESPRVRRRLVCLSPTPSE